jgi:hypothetical protein
MVKQNSLQLLGSSVDFNLITTATLNDNAQAEIEKSIIAITDLRALPFYAHVFRVLRCTHGFLTRQGLKLDSFEMIWKRAIDGTDPLSPNTKLLRAIVTATDPQHWVYNTHSRVFIPSRPFQLVKWNEVWISVYQSFHETDAKYIGSEHLKAIVEVLSPGELAMYVQGCLQMLTAELAKVGNLFIEASTGLRLLQLKVPEDLLSYYRLIRDGYGESRVPKLGQLFNVLRVVGNLTAWLIDLEVEIPVMRDPISLTSTIMSIYADVVKAQPEVFLEAEFAPSSPILHRSFPSLWSVLEFLLCSIHPVTLSPTSKEKPFETFGVSPAITSHILIGIAGQQSIYKFHSVIGRTLDILDVQGSSPTKGDLKVFMGNVSAVTHASQYAAILVHSYVPRIDSVE